MRWLQNHPQFLEYNYRIVNRILGLFEPWLVTGGFTERIFVRIELITKGPIFDCRMCGQCVLHDTGMTCPMTCPKTLRNGPCGGVLVNGHCEVKPEMPCAWLQAWQRSKNMGEDGDQIKSIQPPLNNRLQGTSAWINDMSSEIQLHPKGWQA